jgi:hypothetical protein
MSIIPVIAEPPREGDCIERRTDFPVIVEVYEHVATAAARCGTADALRTAWLAARSPRADLPGPFVERRITVAAGIRFFRLV